LTSIHLLGDVTRVAMTATVGMGLARIPSTDFRKSRADSRGADVRTDVSDKLKKSWTSRRRVDALEPGSTARFTW
jgi:hypothetical protein